LELLLSILWGVRGDQCRTEKKIVAYKPAA